MLSFATVSFTLGFSVAQFSSKSSLIREEHVQDWKEFSSATGGFSIFFPLIPSETKGTLNVGKTIVSRHIFRVQHDKKVYAVKYFDLPHLDDSKAKGDLLAGFRHFVIAELKGELISDEPVSIDNNAGVLLKISVPKRGIAKALILVTATRLYEVSIVPEKPGIPEDEIASAAKKFLESFRLTSIDYSAEGEVDEYLRNHPELGQRAIETGDSKDLLNGKALYLPPPEFPSIAAGLRASGAITVTIIIDEEGKVIAAQAVAGHPLLLSAAEQAARKALFTPTIEQGKPVKVLGRIQYNFIAH